MVAGPGAEIVPLADIELDALNFAVAGGGIALALAAAIWALAERRAARIARHTFKCAAASARAAIALRDALLAEARDALVLWDTTGGKILCHREADLRLCDCLHGPDSADLSAAIERLHRRGEEFTLAARDKASVQYTIRGRVVGGAVGVWLEREDAAAHHAAQLEAMMNALPVPVWLRDRDNMLCWANRVFLEAVGAETIDDARARQVAFDKAERALAETSASEGVPRETERYALIDGAWRAYALMHVPLDDGGTAGLAVDRSRTAEAEVQFKRHLQNQAHLLERLPIAVAVFGPERRLELYNTRFVKLSGLDPETLESKPLHDDLLDRLRDMRKLPEQRDFLGWKRTHLAIYGVPDGEYEDTWPLSDGTTLHVVLLSNPLGGVTVLCEDVSEKFALESSLKTLVAAQSATLDVLSEAVAAFGPDGRLTLHNAAFAEVWELDRAMLADAPHIRAVAEACLEKFGDEAMWERLVSIVSSSPAQRRKWRKIHRTDGSVLSLSTVPLPDRATLVTFADVTHASRIEAALRERNEALELVDRIREEYIRQLSRELRTPLNTVLGFAEHLAASTRGTLPEDLREPLEAIVTGGYVMKNVVDEMLAGLVDADSLPHKTVNQTNARFPVSDTGEEANACDTEVVRNRSVSG